MAIRMILAILLCVVGVQATAQDDRYGSIAFSKNQDGSYAWGIAWSYDSGGAATTRALDECIDQGGMHCAESGWFRNACGALAVGDDAAHGIGWGESTASAADMAMENCGVLYQGENCRVVAARCAHAAPAEEPQCYWVAYAELQCIEALGNRYPSGTAETESMAVSNARSLCSDLEDGDLCNCTSAVTTCCVSPQPGQSWLEVLEYAAPCHPAPGR